ncbi:MAG: helix-turn-helix domain-containing protein [Pseudobacter sp.]|uniref:helix-turn-helix domain-containing protein n=1 Tax=Pseudobacter sp. TaxID=2045420 RepID=UPI003F80BBB0
MNYMIAPELLDREVESKKRRDRIRCIVCNHFNVTMEKVRSPLRVGELLRPRQIMCYLLYAYGKMTLKKIAEYISRDHTTVINCIRRTKEYMETEPKYKEMVEFMIVKIFIKN